MNRRTRLVLAVARIFGVDPSTLAAVTAKVDDSPGWHRWTQAPNERGAGEMQRQYSDALEAWRKNPLAKRIIDCTTDFVLGDGLTPTAPGEMGRWIDRWWNHEQNQMDLRLPDLCDELSRAGDLFLSLHRNPTDGLSYVRPIPKDRIVTIDTRPNDWETELRYHESRETGKTRKWLSPRHPSAANSDTVMIHYSVNRVVGALLGESDLGTVIPWLLRYSRLLEDRVRLSFAARAFLWIVTVPSSKIKEKLDQYSTPPASGSVIVKDESEHWDIVNPDLKGLDAQYDARAIRQMIDAGSGFPPHWRGEATDVSLATARAMENSASRHLRRRQLTLRHIIADLTHTCYTRAWEIGRVRAKPKRNKIQVPTPDIARGENRELAGAAREIADAFRTLQEQVSSPNASSTTLRRRILELVLKFAGQPLTEAEADTIMRELTPPYREPNP